VECPSLQVHVLKDWYTGWHYWEVLWTFERWGLVGGLQVIGSMPSRKIVETCLVRSASGLWCDMATHCNSEMFHPHQRPKTTGCPILDLNLQSCELK
jgi:hypothetical protein